MREGHVDVVSYLLDASFHSGFVLHLASTDFADCVCVALRKGVSGILRMLVLDAAPMEEGGLLRGLLDEERSLVVMALTDFANKSLDTTLFINALKHLWSYETSCLVVLFEAIKGGKKEVVRGLLSHGMYDPYILTVFNWCITYSNADVCEMFFTDLRVANVLDSVVQTEAQQLQLKLNLQHHPLLHAAMQGAAPSLWHLLLHAPIVKANSPLFSAHLKEQVDIALWLVIHIRYLRDVPDTLQSDCVYSKGSGFAAVCSALVAAGAVDCPIHKEAAVLSAVVLRGRPAKTYHTPILPFHILLPTARICTEAAINAPTTTPENTNTNKQQLVQTAEEAKAFLREVQTQLQETESRGQSQSPAQLAEAAAGGSHQAVVKCMSRLQALHAPQTIVISIVEEMLIRSSFSDATTWVASMRYCDSNLSASFMVRWFCCALEEGYHVVCDALAPVMACDVRKGCLGSLPAVNSLVCQLAAEGRVTCAMEYLLHEWWRWRSLAVGPKDTLQTECRKLLACMWKAFHMAVYTDEVPTCSWLLAKILDTINLEFDRMEELLEHYYTIIANMRTALEDAASHGSLQACNFLLGIQNMGTWYIEWPGQVLDVALLAAVKHGHVVVCKRLIDHLCSTCANLQVNSEETILVEAASNINPAICELILPYYARCKGTPRGLGDAATEAARAGNVQNYKLLVRSSVGA